MDVDADGDGDEGEGEDDEDDDESGDGEGDADEDEDEDDDGDGDEDDEEDGHSEDEDVEMADGDQGGQYNPCPRPNRPPVSLTPTYRLCIVSSLATDSRQSRRPPTPTSSRPEISLHTCIHHPAFHSHNRSHRRYSAAHGHPLNRRLGVLVLSIDRRSRWIYPRLRLLGQCERQSTHDGSAADLCWSGRRCQQGRCGQRLVAQRGGGDEWGYSVAEAGSGV